MSDESIWAQASLKLRSASEADAVAVGPVLGAGGRRRFSNFSQGAEAEGVFLRLPGAGSATIGGETGAGVGPTVAAPAVALRSALGTALLAAFASVLQPGALRSALMAAPAGGPRALLTTSTPLAGYPGTHTHATGAYGYGTASISAGVPSHHPPPGPRSLGGNPTPQAAKSSFLERFAGVSDATREVELLGSLSLRGAPPRRESDHRPFLAGFGLEGTGTGNPVSPGLDSILMSQTGGSDSLSMNYPGGRHQSISEKIDSYSGHNSVNMDMNTETKNIWNPANATPFVPGAVPWMPQVPWVPNVPWMAPGGPLEPAAYSFVHGYPSEEGGFAYPGFPPAWAAPPEIPETLETSDNLENPEKLEAQPVAPPGKSVASSGAPSGASSGAPASGGGKRRTRRLPPAPIARSPLLEQIRASDSPHQYSLRTILNHGVEFARDQHGSRFIQQLLSAPSTPLEDKEAIFNEIREVAPELMTDVFGNYVIQKYFEHGTPLQRAALLEAMWGRFVALSLQMYGCRVVQKAVEFVDPSSQTRIMEEFQDRVVQLIKDQNGNHVIQKSIELVRPISQVGFILEAIRGQIYHLLTHPYGCRVIQRLLEFSALKDQASILMELQKFTFNMIQDQYGNYVIQHILEKGQEAKRQEIFLVISPSVVTLSKHKFASNVVEKAIVYGSESQRGAILAEVMKGNEDPKLDIDPASPLALMMKDQYANYVVQKLVEVSRGEKKRLLIAKIKAYLKQISKASFGKHLASIEKLILLAESASVEEAL